MSALAMPRAFRRVLARAIAAAPERADDLRRHYTEVMPHMRAAQLETPMFRAALDWARMPRLGAAIDRLFAVLADADVPVEAALGAASAEAFRAGTPTLAALHARTHFGGFMPMLYAAPPDLAYIASRGLPASVAIDRYLAAPVIHELCHMGRDRDALEPPHVDECVAGWLGTYVLPELAYPVAGDDGDAIYAAPWLAQVGQAIARAFGVRAVIRLHAGVARLPADFCAAAARLGWADWDARPTLHLLSDAFAPEPWLALALDGRELPDDPELDRAIASDALRAMCLETAISDGSLRTRAAVPAGPIVVDAAARTVSAPPRGIAQHELRYWLPPAVAARLAGRRIELAVRSLAELPELAAKLYTGDL